MNALEYVRQGRDRFLAELTEFVAIPSVGAQAEHHGDMERAATWLRDKLLAAGFPRVEVNPTAGRPVVYAEWLGADPSAPTVLVYGHYDVQPPDPLEQWTHPPFEPTVVGESLFGRGSSDDKGQMYAHIAAVQAFHETVGRPPINLKYLFEGEEEVGSPSLKPFIADHATQLRADLAVISDTQILGKDLPSIVYALRGLAYVEVEVTGPDHDLHSGGYGGAVNNPINALCQMIAMLQDKHGHIRIPGFYDKVRRLTPRERAEMAKAPFNRDEWLSQAGVQLDWGEPNYTISERISARPTLDVNGIWGGYIQQGAKTVLPSKAFAKISMRLVPDQQPDEISELIRSYFLQIAPPTVQVQVRDLHGGEPVLVRTDSPAMKAAYQAYAAAFGQEPILTREGGSIPVVATFQQMLGIETILMGFGLPDDRAHSPNEKLDLPSFYKGIELIVHFLQTLGG